ncbi:hypothetical protein QFZ27_004171 [Inquilinus ginsengisoli]|uniref:hypothetical protein n=1 Tax=Inquilinus ginsengisoli TaxID=363840 RepID=UPI003D1A6845
MATTADRINVELRANLAGLPRDLANAAGQFERFERRAVQSARNTADVQIRERRRAVRSTSQGLRPQGGVSRLPVVADSATSRVAEYTALMRSALPSLQPTRIEQGERTQVASYGTALLGFVKRYAPAVRRGAVDIAGGIFGNFLYDKLKSDDELSILARESYNQAVDRFGKTPHEAAERIRATSPDVLQVQRKDLQAGIGYQDAKAAEARQSFISMFDWVLDPKRGAVASGISELADEKSRRAFDENKKFVQYFDDLEDGKITIARIVKEFDLLNGEYAGLEDHIRGASGAEQDYIEKSILMNNHLRLVNDRLIESARAADGAGSAFDTAAKSADDLATAAEEVSPNVGGFLNPIEISDDASVPRSAASIAEIKGSTPQPDRQAPQAPSPAIAADSQNASHISRLSGGKDLAALIEEGEELTESVRPEREKRAEQLGHYKNLRDLKIIDPVTYDRLVEKTTEDQKQLAGAITAVGDVFSNGIKGAKDFNDALDSIGLGLLDLAAKGLFGQGALGGVFNQLLGAGPGGAGLLSLLGGSSEGSSGGGVWSGIGSLFGSLFGGIFGRASGGQVLPGQLYEVGEAGREWFAPSVPGQVIPNHVIKGAAGGGNGANQPITFNISMAGANGDRTIAEIAAAAVKNGLAGVPEINRQHRIRFA